MGKFYKQQDQKIDVHGKTLDREAFDAATEEVNRKRLGYFPSGQVCTSDLTYRKEWQDAYQRHLLDKKKRAETRDNWDKKMVKVEVNWWHRAETFRFIDALGQVESCLEVMEAAIRHHEKVNAETCSWVVFFSEAFGGVDIENLRRWARLGRKWIELARQIYHRPHADTRLMDMGVSCLKKAASTISTCDREIVKYREGVIGGAQTSIQIIEITISVLSTVASGGAAGLAGNAVGKLAIAKTLVQTRPLLAKAVKTSATVAFEAGTKATLETGAKITALYASGEKIKWDEIKQSMMDGFVKDIISGGLSKIFLTGVLKPKLDARFPTTNAFLKANGMEPVLKPRPVIEYLTELISTMKVEVFYQQFVKKARERAKGKKLSLKEMLDEIAIEFLKFNFGDALKKIVVK